MKCITIGASRTQKPGLNRVQAGGSAPMVKPSPLTVIRQIVNTGGYTALYRGMVPTLLREVPGNCAMFSVYEMSKQFFARQQVC